MATAAQSAQNQQNLAFYDRRHPGYADSVAHWDFLQATYTGGRVWFATNIFKYHKEGPGELTARLERAYRFNHTKEVVELVQKYLFKAPIFRNTDAAPDPLKSFWAKTSMAGVGIDQFMRQVSQLNSIFGRVAVVVDNNFRPPVAADGSVPVISQAAVEAANAKVYAYLIPATDILDYAFDEDDDGELLWIKLREWFRDDKDPMTSTGFIQERVRLWTRNSWTLYGVGEVKTDAKGATTREVNQIDAGNHNLGFVPVRLADHTITNNPYTAPALIDEIAYLDRAVANYLSNLDAIIQDQTFSQLAIPASNMINAEDSYTRLLEMGTKRVFTYDGANGGAPEFISPDPKQAGVILAVINKIINEIYHTVGLAGERTKEDNSVGIDNSSGVAKAYDFERVNSLLLSKAQSCDLVENWIAKTVMAWNGVADFTDKLVTYPITFDVMRLIDDLVTAEALQKVEAPIEMRREQMRGMVDKLFPQLKQEIKAKILADIESWDPAAAKAALETAKMAQKAAVAAPNRQGQVTNNTP